MAVVEALLRAHPGRFTPATAQAWVDARRRLLHERCAPPTEAARTASSGCAVTGVTTHARGIALDAAHALARWEAGLGTTCEACGSTLPLERLEAAPAAVRCTACAPASTADTRWCR